MNLILGSYLSLWNKNKLENYILISSLTNEFDPIYFELITKIFKNKEIYYDDYFESFVLLLFCNFNQITSYLLTMMNINSNIMINEEQIDRVLDIFNRQYINVFDFKEDPRNRIYLNDCDAYSMKNFIPWLISCLGFQSLIFGVRSVIIDLTIGNSCFKNISKRITHYYDLIKASNNRNDATNLFMCNKLIATQLPSPPFTPKSLNSNPSTAKNSFILSANTSPDKILNSSNNINNLKLLPSKPPVIPKESCMSKLKRIVLSNEPPQYYYDYYLLYPSANSVNDLILELRSGKGYGLRNRSSTNVTKNNCFRGKVKTMNYQSSNKKRNSSSDNKGSGLDIKHLKNCRVKSCNFNNSYSNVNYIDGPKTIQVVPRKLKHMKFIDGDIKCEGSLLCDKNGDKNIDRVIARTLPKQFSF